MGDQHHDVGAEGSSAQGDTEKWRRRGTRTRTRRKVGGERFRNEKGALCQGVCCSQVLRWKRITPGRFDALQVLRRTTKGRTCCERRARASRRRRRRCTCCCRGSQTERNV